MLTNQQRGQKMLLRQHLMENERRRETFRRSSQKYRDKKKMARLGNNEKLAAIIEAKDMIMTTTDLPADQLRFDSKETIFIRENSKMVLDIAKSKQKSNHPNWTALGARLKIAAKAIGGSEPLEIYDNHHNLAALEEKKIYSTIQLKV